MCYQPAREAIVFYLGSPYLATALRETCLAFSRAIPPPPKIKADKLLIRGVFQSDTLLCQLAMDNGATDFDQMLIEAAYMGSEALCVLARDWGATYFNVMLIEAEFAGHKDLCALARKWMPK